MCGIAGYYQRKLFVNQADLKKMTDAISHRGPDAEGFFTDDHAGLGHRRLSIIDLRSVANQPMHSHDDRYVIVYNGEVYNFRELSAQVRVNNDSFYYKTNSDTEVILEAFVKWGFDFVQRLNGMFAFAIYDTVEKQLFIYRDRIGIKPIFYYWDGELLLFGSELKSILTNSYIKNKLTLDYEAINQLLHLGYVPAPNTIYNEIKKFPAGHRLHISQDIFNLEPYWELEDKIQFDSFNNFDESKKKLKYLIETSVEYRMISDVPFGTFLSGGVDSSLVTAVAQSLSSTPVNTFSIGFLESKHNEAGYAAAVSKQLGTNHHEFTVTTKEAQSLFDDILKYYDEPYFDPSAIPTMLVSSLARKHVTMTLSGDGGDELFLGYGAYTWAQRLSAGPYRNFRSPLKYAFGKMKSRYKRIATLLDIPKDPKQLKSHVFSQEQYFFSRAELSSLLNPAILTEFNLDENYEDARRKLHPMESQALFDLKYYLPDDLLVKVDRATMKYSLETRVPLLDYRIIEFALNMPESFKINKGVQKYILKSVLYDYLPKSLFDRPKWGFSIPVDAWLKSDLSHLVENYTNKEITESLGILNYEYVSELIQRWKNGEDYLYNRVWGIILLQKWLKEYLIK